MSVRLRCWSEDGEEIIDVPQSQLISQFAPHGTTPPPKQPVEAEDVSIKWTMPDDPDSFGDFA
ncbi:hypothetical protein P3W85_44600 [Cupriavidus basilensis]|uniref:Uncharacterized protein n=1 Tax=Cupriavidus basilensis TaxID=68895 RepID=A0ABT6B563_9BURK|nr:hypothetical protein [Cupriavidus basilensis]MDF3839958.1 hypothetical protein [Cupriavidus basilensis]